MAYLHRQGTIHRDIKGANILTTKDGLAKLADFGVATKITNIGDHSVVGTPNWMAPEVIELNGATTASDIWSLGCTIIELLTGKPPYHNFRQMPALFAIVNDEHPPIPDGLSPPVQDFLLQCFQKDPNLRVTAKKLLKHPWMLSVDRERGSTDKNNKNSTNKTNNKKYLTTKYDDAVKTVQMWNDAIERPSSQAKKLTVQKKRDNNKNSINLKKYSEDLHHDKENYGRSDEQGVFNPGARKRLQSKPSNDDPFTSIRQFSQSKRKQLRDMVASKGAGGENWDSEFFDNQGEGENIANKLNQLRLEDNKKHPATPKKASSRTGGDLLSKDSPYREDENNEDFSDLQGDFNINNLHSALNYNNEKPSKIAIPSVIRPSDLSSLGEDRDDDQRQSTTKESKAKIVSANLQEYIENEEEEDYSSIFGNTNDQFSPASSSFVLHPSTSNNGTTAVNSSQVLPSKQQKQQDSSLDNSEEEEEESEDDPFALIDLEEQNYETGDLETNAARDRLARANSQMESLVKSLNNQNLTTNDLADTSQKMLVALKEFPDTKKTIIRSHGLLPTLEVLESRANREIACNLLQCINELIENDEQTLENLCFIGGIPMVTKFASKEYHGDVRYQAALFVDSMCRSQKLVLQMFISCGGLYVLSEFVEEDYLDQKELVLIGIRGIWSVFQLQGSTPRNDICRILSWSSVLDSLAEALPSIHSDQSQGQNEKDDVMNMITSIFFFFSQTESYVKESIASKNVFKTLLRCYSHLSGNHQLTVLKFIKNLSSVPANFIILQNSNAIEILVNILSESTGTGRYKEVASQILHIMFNLCRLSRERQEEAAVAGIVPSLQDVASGDSPLKQLALPILCDLAHAGKTCRKILWQHDGLSTYLNLTSDPYWQSNAYEAISAWLQEEVARVEDRLILSSSKQKLLAGLDEAKSSTFNALLESFHKILRLSPLLCRSLSVCKLLSQVKRRLKTSKAIVRLNLLRLARTVLEFNPNQISELDQSGLSETLKRLTGAESPVLVRELAKELLNLKKETNHDTQSLFNNNNDPKIKPPPDYYNREVGRISPPRMIPRNRTKILDPSEMGR